MSTDNPTTTLTEDKPKQKATLIVQDSSATAYLFDTARFEHCYRIATAMARSSLLPEHLAFTGPKNSRVPLEMEQVVANCFLILNQAIRWGVDPFSVPPETYVVANKLGYQGKLVAAVINARGGLKMPLSAIYNSGRGDDLAAVIFGSKSDIPQEAWPLLKKYAKDEDGDAATDLMAMGVRVIRISVGQAKTSNEMWTKDPAQKLYYSGATKWARRHAPEILLGVLTEDDVERMTIEPGELQPMRSLDQLTDKLIGQNVVNGTAAPSTNGNGHAEAEAEAAGATPTPVVETHDRPEGDDSAGQAPSDTTDALTELDAILDAAQQMHRVGKAEEEFLMKTKDETLRSEISKRCDAARIRIKAAAAKGKQQGTLAGAT